MSDFLRRISIAHWPIWAKLLIGFLLAVAIPVVLVLALTLNTVNQVGSQNVRVFITETSARQARAFSTTFGQALGELADFVSSETNFMLLRRALPVYDTVPVDPNTQFNLAVELQNQLLNTTNSIYQEINLIDPEGQLVIQAKPNDIIVGGADLSQSAAYRQGVEAQLLGLSQALTIDAGAGNQPILDVVNILEVTIPGVRHPVVFGYLIARIDVQRTILDNLPMRSDLINASNRLVTRQGFVIDSNGVQVLDRLDLNVNLFEEALNGSPQAETFVRDNTQFVRYYAPVENSPFVLVSEGQTNLVANQIARFLAERSFALVLGLMFLLAVLVILANQLLSSPLRRISQAIQGVTRGNYNVPLPDARRGDEIGELAGSLADMRRRVLDIINDLEQRIEARSRDITATREISHAAATQRDLQQLMDRVVNLIIERFPNIYHAQIFLIDQENRYAVLRASTGDAGRQLLARGHRLAVGSLSVVGRATETGDLVLARDTATSSLHRRNELLPETLAELAIPLRVGDRIIGALDVQSKQSDTFDEEQQDVLQTMADQVAVAIENARLYTESLRQLQELERNRRVSTLQAWHQYMDSLRVQRLESAVGALPQNSHYNADQQISLARGEVVVGELTERQTIPVAVPIRLRGQLLGAVEWEVPETDFDQNKLQLAQQLTDRLAVNLENARLFQESQRAIRREQLVNEISAQLTAQNDLDQILQTAVREVGKALRAPQVSIRLNTGANGHQNGHTGDEQ
ncbi:MAG TPA: GAF domain-containing protein [Spirillospora sp.]|nr:GAF domain-containing protein [Spirillospora sp.]